MNKNNNNEVDTLQKEIEQYKAKVEQYKTKYKLLKNFCKEIFDLLDSTDNNELIDIYTSESNYYEDNGTSLLNLIIIDPKYINTDIKISDEFTIKAISYNKKVIDELIKNKDFELLSSEKVCDFIDADENSKLKKYLLSALRKYGYYDSNSKHNKKPLQFIFQNYIKQK